MKIFITRADLIAAIDKATNNVYSPRLTPATVTVIEVKASNAIQTKIYVPYPIWWLCLEFSSCMNSSLN
jgi:hypothetical protein